MKYDKEALPRHLGLIMDGNGRWAKKRGLPRSAGHKQGANTFRDIVKYCREIGIEYVTAYTFSTENWKRPKEEIDTIMNLLREYLKETYKFKEENARLCFLGDLTPLDDDLKQMIQEVEEGSRNNTGITVNIAFNYGGRHEIVMAMRKLAQQVQEGTLSPEQIDEQRISNSLYTQGQPDPDLVIRPSGEFRTSNFLLWQSTYAEYVFMDVLWPDFKPAHLDKALLQYAQRSRRFGGI